MKENYEPMKISKSLHIPLELAQETGLPHEGFHGVAIMQVNTAYARKDGEKLLQHYSTLIASDTFGKFFERTSEDNGRTWSQPRPIYRPQKTRTGILRQGEECFLLDEEKNALACFHNMHLYPDNYYTRAVEEYTKIFFRVSFDGGNTFTEPKQIVQEGCTENKWAKGVEFGRNCLAVSFCAPLKLRDGRILLPVLKSPSNINVGPTKSIFEAFESCCFIGEWQGNEVNWKLSEAVNIDSTLSSKGLCEPTVAELKNGSILMICRGSNCGIAHMPGRKWFSISDDGGYTWSGSHPLRYDTGEDFFSPATGSRLIRSSKNNKLYWIGNIVRENPDGNRPRYPLQIAEVDEDKIAVKKNAINIIDDKQENDSEFVQFSNFRIYEDRTSGEFVLHMARIQEKDEKDIASPSYQYRINVVQTV